MWLCHILVAAHWHSCSKACGSLVPWPGVESESSALQRELTSGQPGKSPECSIFDWSVIKTIFRRMPGRNKWIHFSCSEWMISCSTNLQSCIKIKNLKGEIGLGEWIAKDICFQGVMSHSWKGQFLIWPGKGQFSFQSQRKAMPKNAQTTAQLHSSHTLAK